jgi:hypothetical protein
MWSRTRVQTQTQISQIHEDKYRVFSLICRIYIQEDTKTHKVMTLNIGLFVEVGQIDSTRDCDGDRVNKIKVHD